ncbi:MAG: SLC13 family permease [Candidatus Saliniplasma sp.]
MPESGNKLSTILVIFLIGAIITRLPFPEQFSTDAKMMIAIAFVAAALWVTEALPIPVTAMLVILLQGLFGIQPFSVALSFIAHKVNVLLVAGFIIAAGLKKYDLDKRIGLKFVSLVGERTDRLILGIMAGTAFLSMWISNTAATAIMIPIGIGILKKAKDYPKGTNMGKAMILGIAFAANIGGMGTPVGTPPVPITIAFLEDLAGISISFFDWVIRAVPLLILLIPLSWKLVTTIYKPEIDRIEGGIEMVKEELKELGSLTHRQKHFLALFAIALGLWLLSAFDVWLPLPEDWLYIASVLICFIFVFPRVGVLNWKEATDEIGWGILILVGGGLALGSGLQVTGVIDIIANNMEYLVADAGLIFVIAAVGFITAYSITLFSSLTATSSTFVPVAIAMALKLDMSPTLLALVAGVAACFAFLLPANTPPNAIAYSSGYFETMEMTKAGIILTALCISALVIVAYVFWAPFS